MTMHMTNSKDMYKTMCGVALEPFDVLVEAAMQSDCNNCRTAAGVGQTGDKTWEGKRLSATEPPAWTPEPMENADEIIASKKNA